MVFSDLNVNARRACLFPMLVTGTVDLALREAGLRDRVTLCMQSSMMVTPLELITGFALGIDLVNPYLMFCPDQTYQQHRNAYAVQRDNYRKGAMQVSFLAKMCPQLFFSFVSFIFVFRM